MSRPSEIANSVLHRYYNQKQEKLLPTAGTPRPKRIQSVTSIPVAEKFRSFVIRDISTRMSRINDPSVVESQIRDLNEELNKLVNEKLSWEYHIKELGGPDYVVTTKRQLQNEVHVKSYRYFGRAKDLKDIKELMELKKRKKTKTINSERELLKYVNANIGKLDLKEYYALEDEEELETNKVDKQEESTEKNVISNDDLNKVTAKSDFTGKEKSQKFTQERSNIDDLTDPNKEFSFDEFNPPLMEDIEKLLVERKKAEIKARLGI